MKNTINENTEARTFCVDDIEYTFTMEAANGTPVLVARYTHNGESSAVWSADLFCLPESEEEATEWLNEKDWAVELESYLDYNRDSEEEEE